VLNLAVHDVDAGR